MRQATTTLSIDTNGRSLVEITRQVDQWVSRQRLATGLATLFCRHSSASLLITENASPAVRRDLLAYFARLAPEGADRYEHDDEGPDDMPAHLRAALTQTSLSVPLVDGVLVLGTWQGIFLFEHRARPHRREVVLHLIGED